MARALLADQAGMGMIGRDLRPNAFFAMLGFTLSLMALGFGLWLIRLPPLALLGQSTDFFLPGLLVSLLAAYHLFKGVIRLWPNGVALRLHEQGFTIWRLGQAEHWKWEEVSAFTLRNKADLDTLFNLVNFPFNLFMSNKRVFFTGLNPDWRPGPLEKLRSSVPWSALEHTLPKGLPIKGKPLADLMNLWRERALQRAGQRAAAAEKKTRPHIDAARDLSAKQKLYHGDYSRRADLASRREQTGGRPAARPGQPAADDHKIYLPSDP